MTKLILDNLDIAIRKSWGPDTAKGYWKPEVPSLNQCAVTALVVQDYFGGDLLRCSLSNGDSHYWNCLPDGRIVDLSKDQFEFTKQRKFGEVIVRDREYVLSYPDTRKRYEILAQRVYENLGEIWDFVPDKDL